MNLQLVMEEIADKLRAFTGLNVFDYPVDTVTPPAGILSYPDSINYDESYQSGEMTYSNLPVYMVTDRADSKSARNQVSTWTDPHSAESVKAYLDRENYNHCEDVQVVKATFDVMSIAGVDYLVAVFSLEVSGEG
jgi:hypothetical protein